MAISAVMVKMLRDKTGAGMLDCKSALEETNGNVEEAEKILRKKGLAAAAKKAGRVAAEGLIGHKVEGGTAVLVEVNCETRLRREDRGIPESESTRWRRSSSTTPRSAIRPTGTSRPSRRMPPPKKLPHAGATIAESLQAFTGETGENTQLRRFARLVAGAGSALTLYAHPGDKTVVVVETKGMRRDAREGPRDARGRAGPAVREPGRRVRRRRSPTSVRSRARRRSPRASRRPSSRRWWRG